MPVLEPVRELRWIEITYRSSEYLIEEQEVEAEQLNDSQIVEF